MSKRAVANMAAFATFLPTGKQVIAAARDHPGGFGLQAARGYHGKDTWWVNE